MFLWAREWRGVIWPRGRGLRLISHSYPCSPCLKTSGKEFSGKNKFLCFFLLLTFDPIPLGPLAPLTTLGSTFRVSFRARDANSSLDVPLTSDIWPLTPGATQHSHLQLLKSISEIAMQIHPSMFLWPLTFDLHKQTDTHTHTRTFFSLDPPYSRGNWVLMIWVSNVLVLVGIGFDWVKTQYQQYQYWPIPSNPNQY